MFKIFFLLSLILNAVYCEQYDQHQHHPNSSRHHHTQRRVVTSKPTTFLFSPRISSITTYPHRHCHCHRHHHHHLNKKQRLERTATITRMKAHGTILHYKSTQQKHNDEEEDDKIKTTLYKGELVGSTGRIGSFLCRANPNCIPIPRDVRPGTQSPMNTPIFVSVPATQVPSGSFFFLSFFDE